MYPNISCYKLISQNLFSNTGLTSGSSCSEANRISNLDQCLLDIGGFGFNNTAFWFGTQYATNCPNGIYSNTLDCFNPLPQPGSESIFHRLFPDGYDPAHLDRFLDMEFISPAGKMSIILFICRIILVAVSRLPVQLYHRNSIDRFLNFAHTEIRMFFLAHRIRVSEILPWVENFILPIPSYPGRQVKSSYEIAP